MNKAADLSAINKSYGTHTEILRGISVHFMWYTGLR